MRELQNCIERAVILCETSEIQPRHLNLVTDPAGDQGQPADPWDLLNLSGTLEESSRRIHAEFEQHKIAQVMRDVNGDPPLAAARLKILHQDLLGKLKRYQLDQRVFRVAVADLRSASAVAFAGESGCAAP